MPYVKNNTYREIPFCNQTPYGDFYIYCNFRDLISRSLQSGNEVVRCRSIGILQSFNGKFFLTDLDAPLGESETLVRVSMMYLRSPLQSTVIPYPVQVFGTLQWKNRPVIYVNILQVLKVPMALRMRDALSSVINSHKANKLDDLDEELT